MNRALPLLLVLLVLLMSLTPAPAQYYGYGYSYTPSYAVAINYYDGNYHWHNAETGGGKNWPAGYYAWRDGNWHLQNYGYLYPTAATTAPAYGAGWKQKLLDIAANRDKVEGKVRLSAVDHQAYLEAVKALGLSGNFNWQGYGTAPALPNAGYAGGYGAIAPLMPYLAGRGSVTNSLTLGNYGANGNTVYGYSYASVKDLYGSTDPNTLYQQAARLAQNAQTLAGQATGDFSDLVGRDGQHRARIAEILAKGQAAAQALAAAPSPSPQTQTQTRTFSLESRADGGSQIVQQPAPQAATMPQAADTVMEFQQVVTARCAACHGGSTKKGGLDMTAYPSLSAEQKARVWDRLTTLDKDRKMPRAADGGPGPSLPVEELKLFFTH